MNTSILNELLQLSKELDTVSISLPDARDRVDGLFEQWGIATQAGFDRFVKWYGSHSGVSKEDRMSIQNSLDCSKWYILCETL
jgi:hypothetical protein